MARARHEIASSKLFPKFLPNKSASVHADHKVYQYMPNTSRSFPHGPRAGMDCNRSCEKYLPNTKGGNDETGASCEATLGRPLARRRAMMPPTRKHEKEGKRDGREAERQSAL